MNEIRFCRILIFRCKIEKMLLPKVMPSFIAVTLSHLLGHCDLRCAWYPSKIRILLTQRASPDDHTGEA